MSERPVAGSTLSDAFLITAALALLSFGAIIAPLQQLLEQPLTRFAQLELLYVPLTFALTVLSIALSRRRQRMNATAPLDANDPLAIELAAVAPELAQNAIAVSIRGSLPPIDPDPTVPVEPPRILLPGTATPLLIIASRTVARLRTDAAAFRAVLLHEIGHNVLRDTQRIDDIRRFMAVATIMSLAAAAGSVATSYHVDCPRGFCREALVASLLGKGVLWSAIALAVVFVSIRRAMELIRERIADNYVFDHTADSNALERAERLLGFDSPHATLHRHARHHFASGWWVLVGAAIGIVALNVAGVSDYVSQLTRASHPHAADFLGALAAASVDHLFVLFAFLVLSRQLRELEEPPLPRAVSIAGAAMLATCGAWLVYVVVHVLPAAAVVWMPPEFNNVFRSDVPALLFQTITTTLETNLSAGVALAALLLLAAAVPARALPVTRWTLSLAILGSATIELLLRGGALSWLHFGRARFWLVAVIAVAAMLAIARPPRGAIDRKSAIVAAVMLIAWAVLAGSGYHETSLDTATAMRAAAASIDRNDPANAIAVLARAAASTPQIGSVWVALGEAYSDAGRNDEAIAAFDHAARLPGFADWNERLYCYYREADALVDRRHPADLLRARELLREIVRMHRLNARLDQQVVAGALFVYCGVLAQSPVAGERALGMLYLIEADALAPQQHICFLAVTNPQLQEIFAPLHLRDGTVCGLPLNSFHTPEDVYAALAQHYDGSAIECFARGLVRNIARSAS
ncbi:MAG TPA: hypothetical protein VFN10_09655 [Thermoanaerobaculia bacterium]|nr:hypothetical protein [Thermoanaerobaculia bacterium]